MGKTPRTRGAFVKTSPKALRKVSAAKGHQQMLRGPVFVAGEPGWQSKMDKRIKENAKQLAAWKDDAHLRAFAERVLNGDRKKLVGW